MQKVYGNTESGRAPPLSWRPRWTGETYYGRRFRSGGARPAILTPSARSLIGNSVTSSSASRGCLTDEQKAKVNELVGESFKGEILFEEDKSDK